MSEFLFKRVTLTSAFTFIYKPIWGYNIVPPRPNYRPS